MTTSAPPPPLWRRLIPAVVLAAVASLVTVSLAVADSPPTHTSGGAAAAYVPPEGYVSWTLETGGDGEVYRVAEHSRSTGVSELLALPNLQRGSALNAIGGDDVRTTEFWRETTHTLNADDTPRLTDLYTITEAGVALVAGHGGNLGWVYNPPMVQLPAHVAPGVEWEGSGEAIPLGLARYEQTARALEPADPRLIASARSRGVELSGCIQVNSRVLLSGDTDEVVVDLSQRELWCRGMGRVAVTVEFDDRTAHHAHVEPHPDVGGTSALPFQALWSNIENWVVRDATLSHTDTFWGESAAMVSIADTPRVTRSGLIITATTSTNDIIAFDATGSTLQQRWLAHPGGTIVTFATVGDVTVVSTSLRQLVAYDSAGIRLWHSALAELVIAPPTATRDGRIVTAGLDGTVTMIDALTGEAQWSRSLGADIDVAPVATGEVVAAIDRAGILTALDAATGDVAWSRALTPARDLRAFGEHIISAGDDGVARALDAASGAPHTEWRVRGSWRAMLAVGDAVVLATDELTTAVNPVTGAELWRAEGVTAAVSDGTVIVALLGSTATVTDASGVVVAQWDVPASFLWANQYLVMTAERLLLMHSGAEATTVGPR